MNRLDKIKERIQTVFYVFSEENIDGGLNEYREAHEDIEYLLSLNERYRLALKNVCQEIREDSRGNALCIIEQALEE